jgi:hypothetical protein
VLAPNKTRSSWTIKSSTGTCCWSTFLNLFKILINR